MTGTESLKRSILAECAEDHVGLWSIIRDAEDCFPKKNEAAVRDAVLKALSELLLEKAIKAGVPTTEGKFRASRMAPERIIERIRTDWSADQRPTIGEGMWFTTVKRTGRSLDSYVRKYGAVEGAKLYRRLQRKAALASGHARQKKRLRSKQAQH